MYVIILSFLTAFTLTYFAIPSIISIARDKNLYDVPTERSSHTISTPSLGGIGIFAGAVFSIVLWTPFEVYGDLQYALCAFIIIFLIGAKDDISPISPYKKLIGQVVAASILVFKSKIQLTSFHGLLGIHDQLPEWIYVTISLLTILVIVNAFNLIDGINGLAGSIGALITATLGIWFLLTDRVEFAVIAFATIGAVVAFLKYNYTPAKIFMGDTGALLIGLACSILVIEFIEVNSNESFWAFSDRPYLQIYNSPVVAMGIMVLPLYDTIRVFVTRVLRGQSPLNADRRHIHHLLIDYGLTHMQATATLFFVNVFFITFVLSVHQYFEMHALLFIILLLASVMTYYLHLSVIRKRQKSLA